MDLANQILCKLVRYKNGLVSESMAKRGINYKRNYGVAIHEIKRILSDYPPNHQVAQNLWDKQIRETMIAAIYLSQPEMFTQEQLLIWSMKFNNPEIVEQISMNLLYRCSHTFNLIFEWLYSKDIYLQKCAWLTIARMESVNWSVNFLENLKDLLVELSPNEMHLKNSLIYSISKIALNNEAKIIVRQWCLDETNNQLQHNLKTELLALNPFLSDYQNQQLNR